MNKIKLVVFDLDGVFTNGKIYVTSNGTHIKCYNGKDTYGIKLLQSAGIQTGLITAHTADVLQHMEHIYNRMDMISSGSYEKLSILSDWKTNFKLTWDEIAYMGDDLPDLECIQAVGLSACPNDAVDTIKINASYICNNNGGNGAVREFCEKILNK